MLLSDYNRIAEIDTTISDLHAQLAALYNERSSIVVDTPKQTASTAKTKQSRTTHGTTIENEWELELYNNLKQEWLAFGVQVPTYKKLQAKLSQAKYIILDLAVSLPDNSFSVLLMPPTAIFNTLVANGTLENNGINLDTGVEAPKEAKRRSWSVQLVAANPVSVPADSNLLTPGNDPVVGGYTMPGLSAAEYATYLLMNNAQWVIDDNSWSILPRTVNVESGLVTCVAYIGNTYRFDTDTTDVLIGNNHFRPAMEIQ